MSFAFHPLQNSEAMAPITQSCIPISPDLDGGDKRVITIDCLNPSSKQSIDNFDSSVDLYAVDQRNDN